MNKSQLSWLAVTLTLAGVAVLTGHPAWGLFTGGAILLAAGAVAAGAVRTPSELRIDEAKIGAQKIPHSLVTLSAAAIIAVYAAGFQRTRSAEEEFEAKAARRRAAAVVALGPPPAAVLPEAAEPPIVPPPIVYPGAKNGVIRSSPDQAGIKTPPSQPAPSQRSQAEPSPASASSSKSPCWPNRPAEGCLESRSKAAPSGQSSDSAAAPTAAQQVVLKDGKYLGWGSCFHGDIEASVVIRGGKVESAVVASCQTRYSCSVVNPLRGQVVTRQSATVDFISGATESSEAFADAVAAALAQARE